MIDADLNILKTDVEDAIYRFAKLQRGNKKKAEIVVVTSASISAVTTIFIGLASMVGLWSGIFQGFALILSASLTILTAWDGLYNHKRLWLLQAGIVNALYSIQSDIRHYEACGQSDQSAINTFYLRYRSAFDEYNSQWIEMRADERLAPRE